MNVVKATLQKRTQITKQNKNLYFLLQINKKPPPGLAFDFYNSQTLVEPNVT